MKTEEIKKYQLDGYFTLNENDKELSDFKASALPTPDWQ